MSRYRSIPLIHISLNCTSGSRFHFSTTFSYLICWVFEWRSRKGSPFDQHILLLYKWSRYGLFRPVSISYGKVLKMSFETFFLSEMVPKQSNRQLKQIKNTLHKRRFYQYTEDQLQRAIFEIRENTMSINKASKEFNVPKTSIIDRMEDQDLTDVKLDLHQY